MGQLALNKSRNIHQLRPWHRSIARAVACGMRPEEIVKVYGYHPSQVSVILGSPLFQAEVARIEAQAEGYAVSVHEDLKLMAVRAAEILDREIEVDPDNLDERKFQTTVAFGVLDRSGHPKGSTPVSLHRHEHVHVSKMSDEELYRDVIEMVEEDEEE